MMFVNSPPSQSMMKCNALQGFFGRTNLGNMLRLACRECALSRLAAHATRTLLGVEMGGETSQQVPEKPIAEWTKEECINVLLQYDAEVLELKRIHELSMMRTENVHQRSKMDSEDNAMYFEQTAEREVMETVDTTQHTKKNVIHHHARLRVLRKYKAVMVATATLCFWSLLMRWYVLNPNRRLSTGPVISTIYGKAPDRTLAEYEKEIAASLHALEANTARKKTVP